MTTARKDVGTYARARAQTYRRQGRTEDAVQYDVIATEVEVPRDEYDEISRRAEALQARLELSPKDFDVQTRGRAFEEALLVAGLDDLARIIRVLTDMASGDCPLHGRRPVDVWSAATPEQLNTLVEEPDVAALHKRMVTDTGERHDLDDVIAELGIDVSESKHLGLTDEEHAAFDALEVAPEDVLTVKALEDLRDAVAAQPAGRQPVAISPQEAAAWFPQTGEPHECCPDCGDDPNDHTMHAAGCRRIGTTEDIQCGPPWNPVASSHRLNVGGSGRMASPPGEPPGPLTRKPPTRQTGRPTT